MAFWQTLSRLRRGDLATLVFATFLAFALVPGAMVGDAPFLPTEAHAVLFWLQNADSSVAPATAAAPFAPPPTRTRTSAAPAFSASALSLRPLPPTRSLDAPVVAFLSGVRTNRFLI